MIYLDGSRFFFDIEGCFSDRVTAARLEHAADEHDPAATEICKGFAAFFGAKPENVRAAKDYAVLFGAFLPQSGAAVIVPEFDEAADIAKNALPGAQIVLAKKTPDMKIREVDIADAHAVFMTNPCCPSSLELSADEIKRLALSTEKLFIVDESHMVGEENSAIKLVEQLPNLVVLKKMRFGGEPVFACGKNLPQFDCGISAADEAAANVIFNHTSALKTALRKLTDSRDSLYIRIKKLAVKYDSVERLFRTKADCVFFKVRDAQSRYAALLEHGVSIRCSNDYFCVFAGDKDENEAVLTALEQVLK